MSSWTYVQGLIELGVPGRTQAEKDYILQTVIDHLPKVTGSEGNMDIHTVRAYGHNMWSNRDELDNLNLDFKTQSRYFLVLDGHLRDRQYADTFKEINKFLNRLAKRLRVDSLHVQLNTYNHFYTFDSKNDCYENNCYGNMFDGKNPWYDYLMWEWKDDD